MGPGGPAGLFAQFAQYGVTCATHIGSADKTLAEV